jgi:hypothetical protein
VKHLEREIREVDCRVKTTWFRILQYKDQSSLISSSFSGTISSATTHAHSLSPSYEVEYGLERINHEVSNWMKHANNPWGQATKIPFIAIRGFDSIVWSRLYSHETFENPEDKIQVHCLQLWLYIYIHPSVWIVSNSFALLCLHSLFLICFASDRIA